MERECASRSHTRREDTCTSSLHVALGHPLHHRPHHLSQRVCTLTTSSTTAHLTHLCAKRLSKYLLYSTITEELLEYFVRIYVMKALVLVRFFAKHVVMLSFLRVTQASICLANHFEGFLRVRCMILIRVHF